MVVYVAVSLAAIGNLSIPAIIKAEDNALAEAAKPFLGNAGFILISVGALFSVSSAINATLFGGANVAYSLAKDGQLPIFFERKTWRQSPEGLYITAILSLVFVLALNLASIAAIISSIFTIIYIFVLISHYRLAGSVGGSRRLIFLNIIVLGAVLAGLIYYQWQNQRTAFYGTIAVLGGVIVMESLYRRLARRRLRRGGSTGPMPPDIP